MDESIAFLKIISKYSCLYQTHSMDNVEFSTRPAWRDVAKEIERSGDTCKDTLKIALIGLKLSSKLALHGNYLQEFIPLILKLKARTEAIGRLLPPPIVETETDKTKEQNKMNTEKDARETFTSTQEHHLTLPRCNKRAQPCSDQIDNVCVNCSQQKTNGSPADDYRKSFLISLLPEVNELSDIEMREFKIKVLMLLDEMLTKSQHERITKEPTGN